MEPRRVMGANLEALRLKMEPWMICRPIVADSHQFDKEQDPDPRVPYVKRLIRICIKWCGSGTLIPHRRLYCLSLVEHLITVQDIKENFYTLAWTTLRLDSQPTNILASGGIRGEIRMFHPANKVSVPLSYPVLRRIWIWNLRFSVFWTPGLTSRTMFPGA